MIVLRDRPDPLEPTAPSAPAASLASGERALWSALGMGARVWRREDRSSATRAWALALVAREAPDSQLDLLRAGLASGLDLPGPTACLALSGRRFHGQRGRPWQAVPGNLHLCTAFPEPGLRTGAAHALTMLPAVALVDAVREVTDGALEVGIKWVNDVLVRAAKVGGVLTVTQSQADRLTSVLFGLGLNVAAAPRVEPTPFVPSVSCLAAEGADVALPDVLTSVLAALARRMDDLAAHGTASLLDAYRAASLVIGREVCVFDDATPGGPAARHSRPIARGVVRGIAEDLSLVLEGRSDPVTRGRLAFVESVAALDP